MLGFSSLCLRFHGQEPLPNLFVGLLPMPGLEVDGIEVPRPQKPWDGLELASELATHFFCWKKISVHQLREG